MQMLRPCLTILHISTPGEMSPSTGQNRRFIFGKQNLESALVSKPYQYPAHAPPLGREPRNQNHHLGLFADLALRRLPHDPLDLVL